MLFPYRLGLSIFQLADFNLSIPSSSTIDYHGLLVPNRESSHLICRSGAGHDPGPLAVRSARAMNDLGVHEDPADATNAGSPCTIRPLQPSLLPQGQQRQARPGAHILD
ncbi:hypothetical protein COCOBI_18-2540 [Coccomyxa sp. Obi]|nr:hypothetical protein COCOBI_18-2540 [Coccomyxa sp. Obi]